MNTNVRVVSFSLTYLPLFILNLYAIFVYDIYPGCHIISIFIYVVNWIYCTYIINEIFNNKYIPDNFIAFNIIINFFLIFFSVLSAYTAVNDNDINSFSLLVTVFQTAPSPIFAIIISKHYNFIKGTTILLPIYS